MTLQTCCDEIFHELIVPGDLDYVGTSRRDAKNEERIIVEKDDSSGEFEK